MLPLSAGSALLVVDVQNGYFFPPYSNLSAPSNPEAVANIAELLSHFRNHELPVIHIFQHSLKPESPFNPNTNPQGYTVQSQVAPLSSERVIVKHQNSAFIGTDLDEYLKKEEITTLVIAGLTLEHCISSTCRHAGNLGYRVFLPRESTGAYEVSRAPGSVEAGKIAAEVVQEVIFGALHEEFVTVVSLAEVVSALGGEDQ